MIIKLIVLEGVHRGRKITLPRTQFVIGRDSSCHLRPVNPSVSKFHCAIAHQENRVVIRDLKSTNGTFLNGRRIRGTAKAGAGDVLEVGPLKIGFEFTREPESCSDSSIEWLMRSPNELETKALDPLHSTMMVELHGLSGDSIATAQSPPATPTREYSEEATVVAGQFLREYMATRKKPSQQSSRPSER